MSNSDNQEKIPFTVDSKSGSNQNYGSHPLLNNDSNDSSPHSNHESVTASTFTTGLSFREALQETISAIELRPRASIIGINNNSPMPAPLMFRIQGREAVEVRDHCHRPRSEGIDVKARRKLIVASILCLCFMICEVIGGVLSNSLAIATDAAHLLTDFAGFMISLLAIWIAGRPSTQRMSFGWYRAEIIGALASVVLIWFITAILVWLAIERVVNQDFELDAKIMLITSGLAIVINIILIFDSKFSRCFSFSKLFSLSTGVFTMAVGILIVIFLVVNAGGRNGFRQPSN